MGVDYSSAAGYGIVFTGDEAVAFVKKFNIGTYSYYDWDCAEAINNKYNLDFVVAGDSAISGGVSFLFGDVLQLNSYDSDQFQFNKITDKFSENKSLQLLAKDSGKEPAFYAGMHFG